MIVQRTADGEYRTVPTPPRPDDERVEMEPEPVPVRIDIEPLVTATNGLPASSPTGVRQVTR